MVWKVFDHELEVPSSSDYHFSWNLDWPVRLGIFLIAMNQNTAARHARAVVQALPEAPFFCFCAGLVCSIFFFQYDDTMTSFPSGRCWLGVDCCASKHQLWKHCLDCEGLIRMLCGQCLVDDRVASRRILFFVQGVIQGRSNLTVHIQSGRYTNVTCYW